MQELIKRVRLETQESAAMPVAVHLHADNNNNNNNKPNIWNEFATCIKESHTN